jgi:hypothetical protein
VSGLLRAYRGFAHTRHEAIARRAWPALIRWSGSHWKAIAAGSGAALIVAWRVFAPSAMTDGASLRWAAALSLLIGFPKVLSEQRSALALTDAEYRALLRYRAQSPIAEGPLFFLKLPPGAQRNLVSVVWYSADTRDGDGREWTPLEQFRLEDEPYPGVLAIVVPREERAPDPATGRLPFTLRPAARYEFHFELRYTDGYGWTTGTYDTVANDRYTNAVIDTTGDHPFYNRAAALRLLQSTSVTAEAAERVKALWLFHADHVAGVDRLENTLFTPEEAAALRARYGPRGFELLMDAVDVFAPFYRVKIGGWDLAYSRAMGKRHYERGDAAAKVEFIAAFLRETTLAGLRWSLADRRKMAAKFFWDPDVALRPIGLPEVQVYTAAHAGTTFLFAIDRVTPDEARPDSNRRVSLAPVLDALRRAAEPGLSFHVRDVLEDPERPVADEGVTLGPSGVAVVRIDSVTETDPADREARPAAVRIPVEHREPVTAESLFASLALVGVLHVHERWVALAGLIALLLAGAWTAAPAVRARAPALRRAWRGTAVSA